MFASMLASLLPIFATALASAPAAPSVTAPLPGPTVSVDHVGHFPLLAPAQLLLIQDEMTCDQANARLTELNGTEIPKLLQARLAAVVTTIFAQRASDNAVAAYLEAAEEHDAAMAAYQACLNGNPQGGNCQELAAELEEATTALVAAIVAKNAAAVALQQAIAAEAAADAALNAAKAEKAALEAWIAENCEEQG